MDTANLRQLFSLLKTFRSEANNRSDAARIVLGEVAVLIVEGEQRVEPA